jgi:hypothetical protein
MNAGGKVMVLLPCESSRLVKKGNNLGYYHGDDSREIITGEKSIAGIITCREITG